MFSVILYKVSGIAFFNDLVYNVFGRSMLKTLFPNYVSLLSQCMTKLGDIFTEIASKLTIRLTVSKMFEIMFIVILDKVKVLCSFIIKINFFNLGGIVKMGTEFLQVKIPQSITRTRIVEVPKISNFVDFCKDKHKGLLYHDIVSNIE